MRDHHDEDWKDFDDTPLMCIGCGQEVTRRYTLHVATGTVTCDDCTIAKATKQAVGFVQDALAKSKARLTY